MKAPELIGILSENFGDSDDVTLSVLTDVLEDALTGEEFDEFFDRDLKALS